MSTEHQEQIGGSVLSGFAETNAGVQDASRSSGVGAEAAADERARAWRAVLARNLL